MIKLLLVILTILLGGLTIVYAGSSVIGDDENEKSKLENKKHVSIRKTRSL